MLFSEDAEMNGLKNWPNWLLAQSHYGVGILVLAFASLVVMGFYNYEWERLSTEFNREAAGIGQRIQSESEDLVADVDLTRQYIETIPELNRKNFHEIAMLLYNYRRHGHYGISWTQCVPRKKLPEFLARWRAEYGQTLNLHAFPPEPRPPVDVKPGCVFPVTYVEPLETNFRALGFDETSSHVRSAAMAEALRTRGPVASDFVKLAGEVVNKNGYTIFVPAFDRKGGQGGNLRGFVIGPFRSSELKKYFSRHAGDFFSIQVYDLRSETPGRLLTAWEPVKRGYSFKNLWFRAERLNYGLTYSLAGRQYRIVVAAGPEFISSRAVLNFFWIIPWGLLAAWLAGAWTRRQTRRLLNAEDSIRQKDARLLLMAEIMQNTSAGIAEIDTESLFPKMINPAFAAMHGYSVKEMLATSLQDILTPRSQKLIDDALGHPATGQLMLETEHVRKDGTVFYGLDSIKLKVDAKGRYCSAIVSLTDVTWRKQAELESWKLKAYLQTILDNVPYAVIASDRWAKIAFFNQGAERLLGYSAGEVIGEATPLAFHEPGELKTRLQLKPGEEELPAYQDLRQWMETRPEVDWTFLCKDGRRLLVQLSISSITNPAGETIGYLEIAEDVSEKRIAEAENSQTRKMGALGQLSAGIAHEINTPMQFISDNLDFFQNHISGLFSALDPLLERSASGDTTLSVNELRESLAAADYHYLKEEVPLAIQQSLEGARRINEIVKSFKNFSRDDAGGFVSVDCGQILNDALVMSRNAWKNLFEVTREFAPDMPRVEASPGELGQVFINLIINAVDAVPEGGTEKKQLRVRASVLNENWVELSVSNNGPCIPPAVQERIFDPFFTTKPVGKGSGQGLFISRKIVVEHHHGRLFLTSDAERTTFFIQLPITQKSPATAPAVTAPVGSR
jgi:two-component system, NtrC family, sensor kinase